MRGKLKPQATDIEEIVIGGLLIDGRATDEVMDYLRPDVFYLEKNQMIFEAIQNLYNNQEAIDLKTVSNQLKKSKNLSRIGGDFHLIDLTQKISSAAHIDHHGRILMQKYIQRELIKNSSAIIENAYEDGVDSLELLDKAFDHLGEVSNLIIRNKEINIKELTAEIIDYGGKLFRNEVKPGIETPISHLTNRMGGWRNGELIILAARPGMGKTAFALKTGWLAALQQIPVAFFSLEMSATRLLSRIFSMDLKIDNDKFTKDGLSPAEQEMIMARMNDFDNIPFYIDDTSSLTIQSLFVKAKKLKKNKGIKLLIIDYLQLMSGNSKNREQEISKISRGLKMIAIELDIPVIALSQLSRAVETRGGNKRPLLSDLRESGAIEQDADVVGFLYRPEYYGNETWDDYEGVSCVGEAEYIISKNRNGGLVRNRMKFEGRYTRFSDIDEETDVFDYPEPIKLNENVTADTFGPPTKIREDEDELPF
jgi:replicative DNA helicase